METSPIAIRATLLYCRRDPGLGGNDAAALCYEPDAIVLCRNGRIERVAPAASLLPQLGADVTLHDERGRILVPGFIDAHVHFPQVDVIASYGTQLLDWLNRYTFPAESRFADEAVGQESAEFFIDRLLENGTTTAAVYCTVHAQSVDAFFTAAEARNLRMIAGKCLMDRHAPDALLDIPSGGYEVSKSLIERWHGHARSLYALTPRFAPTSSEGQMRMVQQLAKEHPDTYIQSHVAENRDEVRWAMQLFPGHRSYLDIYDHYGLLRDRAIYGHSIYLDDADRARMTAAGASPAFCPTSNLFIGSGLYDLQQALIAGNKVSLGTDVGGGTSYSMLRTLAEAYKVQQLQGVSLSPAYALYMATLGGAKALQLDDRLGSIEAGKEADFALLDPQATPLLKRRTGLRDDPLDTFFALMTLGDDRAIAATYAAGVRVYQKA